MMDVDEDIFAGFDLEEMQALENGDLSLFSNLLDPNFRIGSSTNSAGDSESNPSPVTPSSAEELALALQMDEDDPKLMNSNFFNNFKSPNYSDPISHTLHHNNNNNNQKGNENFNKTSHATILGNEELLAKQQQNLCDDQPAPPPLIVCPIEVGKASITLQKNQLCACKECGKLFKSIWYLKQHAVRHSNERPFKCNFCQKAFKFRSNLYQHNCPERLKQRGGLNTPLRSLQPNGSGINPVTKKRFYTRGIAYTENYGNPSQQLQSQSNMTHNEEDLSQQFQKPQQQLLYGGQDQGQQQMANMNGIFGGAAIGANMQQSLEPDFQSYGVQQPLNFELKTEMDGQQIGSDFPGIVDPQQVMVENNSIRDKPLDPEFIDNYLQKNRHRIYSCRKCKINFPYREYLQRHMAYHTDLDNRSFNCDQCPQRFTNEKQLESHLQKHSDDSPHRCFQCNGGFRSALALRRHKDQCRQCYCPPFGAIYQQQPQMISPNAVPLDQYAFIDSDLEEDDPLKNLGLNRQKSTADSGMGSDSSTHSYATSPISNRTGLDDELDLNSHHHHPMPHPTQPIQYPQIPVRQNSKSPLEKTVKDDETDSGFRSRLNSTAQSCSPGSSSFSSDPGESPTRKFSKTGPHHPHEHQMQGHPNDDYGNRGYNLGGTGFPQQSTYQQHRNTHGHMTRQNNVVHYDGGSGNNWSTYDFEVLSNDYEVFNGSDGPMSLLQMGPANFKSSVLGGKSTATLIERLEVLNISDDICAHDQIYPNQPFDIDVMDPKEVAEELICLFLKRLIAVFLDIAIKIARMKHEH